MPSAVATAPRPHATPVDRPRSRRASLAARTSAAAGVALAVNTLVFAIGRIGEPIRVVVGNQTAPEALRWVHVAATTLVSIALGGLVLAVMRRLGRADRTWTIGALVVAALSAVPLWRLDVDPTSKTLLTVMHLTTGICCAGIVAARLRRPS